MRVISVHLKNFASYKELDFQFDPDGLTLISGPTGAGKSTLCDALPWILFGRTAKDGSMDEVLSWPGNEVTEGSIVLELGNKDSIWLVRKRGPKAKDNDLVYYVNGVWEHSKRGKDLPDTQKRINEILGFTVETYLSGAYYHEFSQTAQFFSTTPKNRRTLCEQLVDLSMPKNLQEQAKKTLKAKEISLAKAQSQFDILTNQIKYLSTSIEQNTQQKRAWDRKQKQQIKEAEEKSETFVFDKNIRISEINEQIIAKTQQFHEEPSVKELQEALSNLPSIKCKSCGNIRQSPEHDELVEAISEAKDSAGEYERVMYMLHTKIESIKKEKNQFDTHIEYLKSTANPYKTNVSELVHQEEVNRRERADMESSIQSLKIEVSDLELLSDIVADFRSLLISNTISEVESGANSLLEKHFDAEIRVQFQVEDADKLEVFITKDGNNCSFTQLSKGQRQILKLCFGISVMQTVANRHGVKFHQVFIDEALDGLDDNMKNKAFNLLNELSTNHDSIYVVEHSTELKSRFSTQYHVALHNGVSTISKE